MSNQITAPITLIQNVITAPVSLGVAGGGAGASAFTDLTDKATADIPTINTPLATALDLLAPKASPTFTGIVTIPSGASISGYLTEATAASTYAPIATTVTLTGNQTLENKTFANTTNFGNISASGNIFSSVGFSGPGGNLTGLDAANITGGNVALARIANALTAPGPIGGTTPAAISVTTVTASGAVTGQHLLTSGYVKPAYVRLGNSPNECRLYAGSANGTLQIWNLSESSGILFDVSTNGTVKVRNTSNSADGNITAANLTASGVIKTGSQTAAVAIASSHATAIAAGDGAQTYISDTDKPAWSNGTVWKYADGTTVS